jgi:hypothetical protein
MKWLFELNVVNHQLLLSQDAYIKFKAFWERVEVAQRDGGELTGALQARGGKLAGNMLRVAALIHVASYAEERNIPSTLTGETMQNVVEVGEYFIEHSKAAFGYIGVDKNTENARYLLKVINNQGSDMIPLQTLWQKSKKRMGSAETIRKAVTVLGECFNSPNRQAFLPIWPRVRGIRGEISGFPNRSIRQRGCLCMMAAAELIRRVEAAGSDIVIEGERLKLVRGKLLPSPLVEELRAEKSEILEILMRDQKAKEAWFQTLLTGDVYMCKIVDNAYVFVIRSECGK